MISRDLDWNCVYETKNSLLFKSLILVNVFKFNKIFKNGFVDTFFRVKNLINRETQEITCPKGWDLQSNFVISNEIGLIKN